MRSKTTLYFHVRFHISNLFRDTAVQKSPPTPTPNFGEIMSLLGCPGKTRFPVDKHFKHILTKINTSFVFGIPSSWQTFFKIIFFRNISNTVRDIKNVYRTKSVDFLIYNYLLPRFTLVSPAGFWDKRFEKLKERHLILGKIFPRLCSPTLTPDWEQIF